MIKMYLVFIGIAVIAITICYLLTWLGDQFGATFKSDYDPTSPHDIYRNPVHDELRKMNNRRDLND